MTNTRYSIIAPCYNEEGNLPEIEKPMLCDALGEAAWVEEVKPATSNIVICRIEPELRANDIVKGLEDNGLRCLSIDNRNIRMVTHLNISREEIVKAAGLISNFIPG